MHAFLLGPLTGDHWLIYVADYVDRPTSDCVDRTLDVMMFGIDESMQVLHFCSFFGCSGGQFRFLICGIECHMLLLQ